MFALKARKKSNHTVKEDIISLYFRILIIELLFYFYFVESVREQMSDCLSNYFQSAYGILIKSLYQNYQLLKINSGWISESVSDYYNYHEFFPPRVSMLVFLGKGRAGSVPSLPLPVSRTTLLRSGPADRFRELYNYLTA